MWKQLWLAGLCSFALVAGNVRAELAADYQVVLLTENFPPYNMATANVNFARDDNIQGIAVDMVREMFQRAEINYHLTLRFPWSRIYKMALDNANYGVFVTARLPERESQFKWVGPIGLDEWVILGPSDGSIRLNSLADARHYRVGAYKGDAIAKRLENAGLEPLLALRDQENARKLEQGQIDLWATGDSSWRYLAKQEGLSNFKTLLRFDRSELYLALNPGVPDEVVERLQSELDKMRSEGAVDQIVRRYL